MGFFCYLCKRKPKKIIICTNSSRLKSKLDVSDTEDLAADMMSLLASFSGKFYGKRSAERRKRNEESIQS